MVGERVMVSHPSTNHNSLRWRVVHKVIQMDVLPELLKHKFQKDRAKLIFFSFFFYLFIFLGLGKLENFH